MSEAVRNLNPKALWNHFADLNTVPRPSKKEENVIQFMVDFGKKLNLKTFVDKVGNVIIKKTATKGFENRKKVILQSHLDMVHQKNADTIFDFEKEGINMFIENDWVTANGTTLGADNGLGVAAIMAILSSNEVKHPAIEALFTIDEETGMTGAMGLEAGILEGEILLNLDTEEDDEIGIGCAGGVDVTATKTYRQIETQKDSIAFSIAVTGLQGGHSGVDIHKGLANANKIMNRLLFEGTEKYGLRIHQLQGGSLRNAIPRESFAIISINNALKDSFIQESNVLISIIEKEFLTVESNLTIIIKETLVPDFVMELNAQKNVLRSIYGAVNGVYRMSPDIANLVETSNNIAKVIIENGTVEIACLTRSSSESNKIDLSNALKATFELAGFSVVFSGEYPGWQPNLDSAIVKTATTIYTELFSVKPNVAACHAGLECGILGQNYPEIDMVSFGPTIKGAHSPDERASISSTQKFWKFLTEILKNIPYK